MKEFFEYLQQTYPFCCPQDIVKTLYQCFFGAGHAVDKLRAIEKIDEELTFCPEKSRTEELYNGYVRYHLGKEDKERVEAVAELFTLAASLPVKEGFNEALQAFNAFPFRCFSQEEKERFLAQYEPSRPLLSHSELFRARYSPHYRMMPAPYARLIEPLAMIRRRAKKSPFVIAIDGRCGGGKSTLAAILAETLPARVIHCDDFFIPKADRDKAHEINLDHERFFAEVSIPLMEGKPPLYRKYDCQRDIFSYCETEPAPFYIVEGSYALAPQLGDYYDFSLFCDVSPDLQEKRLLAREGEGYKNFRDKWIPSEEDYFLRYGIEKKSDMVL